MSTVITRRFSLYELKGWCIRVTILFTHLPEEELDLEDALSSVLEDHQPSLLTCLSLTSDQAPTKSELDGLLSEAGVPFLGQVLTGRLCALQSKSSPALLCNGRIVRVANFELLCRCTSIKTQQQLTLRSLGWTGTS